MEPRILFIADEIPQTVNAGSIQFYRLFKNYPNDKLLIVGKQASKFAETLDCPYHTLNFPLLERLRLSRFTTILSNLQALGFCLPVLPKRLRQTVENFKPEIVITLMQHLTYYYPAYHFAKSKKLPLTVFCHDSAEDFSGVGSIFLRKLIKRNSKIYSYATKRFCISPEMEEQWAEKYKVKGDFLYPVASQTSTSRNLEANLILKAGCNLTIGYAGSLSYGYREGIIEILPALERANAVLNIYREEDPSIPMSPNIVFKGFAKTPEETWERIKDDCDAVILPYSANEKFKSLYSTHFPSKLPEYLSLGMPVIINGPGYANGVKWGKHNSKSVVACDNDTCYTSLLKLAANSQYRVSLVASSKHVTDFESNNLPERFLH